MLEHVSKVHEFSIPQFFEVCDTPKHSLPLKCKNGIIPGVPRGFSGYFHTSNVKNNDSLPGQAATSQASLAVDFPTQSAPDPD